MTDKRVIVIEKDKQDRILHTMPVWARDRIAALEAECDALKQDAERTHERICQAIDCRNMGDHAKGWDILRQWLVDVADAAREKV